MTYETILTATGAAILSNAYATGSAVNLTHMSVGDGNGSSIIPTEAMTALVHEVYRTPVSTLNIDPENSNWLVVEAAILSAFGGWTIREIGLHDSAGNLIAVGNFPDTYKPVLAEGSARDLLIRMIVQTSKASVVTLQIDPGVMVATKETIDNTMAAHEAKSNPHPQYATKTGVQAQAHTAAAAGGTADAITAVFSPAVTALAMGMLLTVRSFVANTATTPTFTPNSGIIAAKTIVKGNGLPLVAGDIAGDGHWLVLQYDSILDKWVLLNPATGAVTVTAGGDPSYADNGPKPASTGWVRGAMSAIATAAGFAISLGSAGYIKLPTWLGGLIIQWRAGVASASADTTLSWPIVFPGAVYAVFVSSEDTGAVVATAYGGTTTSCIVNKWAISGASRVGGAVRLLAIGS